MNNIITIIKKGIASSLLKLLSKRYPRVDKFVLQLEDIPIYITYRKINDNISKLILQDVGTNKCRTLYLEIDDSITHLLFILSSIRDEYKEGILFTNETNIV